MNTLVMEDTELGEMPTDVYQKLSEDRILFVCNEITDNVAIDLCASLILKNHENSEDKITLFINSQGGNIRNVLMIYDVMQFIQAPIQTICIGEAMDEAAILLIAGEPGLRKATKNARISIAQLEANFIIQSNLTDAENILNLNVSDNKRMMQIVAKCTNKKLKEINEHFNRRVIFTSSQAVQFGLIDKIAESAN